MAPKEYIKYIRKITIGQAARELGYSRQQVSNAINGKPVGRKFYEKFIRWTDGQVTADDFGLFQ